MCDTLEDYMGVMSRGAQHLNVHIIKRTDDSTKAWIAPYNPLHYAALGDTGYANLNATVMRDIGTIKGQGVWSGLDIVTAIHYSCASCPSAYTANEDSCNGYCNWGGLSQLGLSNETGVWPPNSAISVPGFSGVGVSERIYYYPNLNTPLARKAGPFVTAHEYGHKIGLRHWAGSDYGQGPANPGKFDIMRAGSGHDAPMVGMVPYFGMQLTENGWLEDVVLPNANQRDVHIHDIRGAEGALYELPADSTRETYFIGASGFGVGKRAGLSAA
jgi:hypothetical protein